VLGWGGGVAGPCCVCRGSDTILGGEREMKGRGVFTLG